MKSLPWILVCLLVCVVVWMRCNPHDPQTMYVKGDTIRVRDTIVDIVLMPVKETLKRTDTPTLDFMEVYRDNKIVTLTPVQKRKRWGLGLQAGYSYPGGLYFGVGVSYNLFMW